MSSEFSGRPPYRGLSPYKETDAPFFFGREKETRLITAHLFAAPLTLLYGASGVGKSSVLRAGVLHHLRSRQDLLVVVFPDWQSNPVEGLKLAIAKAEARASGKPDILPDPQPLAEYLAACSERLDRRLMIILDQFEEYFLYHSQDDAFATEFPEAVMQTDAPISFLISIREDAFAKLDHFEDDIPILFDNYLRIEHLNREAARDAIKKPIEQYNQEHAASDQPISIEPALIDAVLDQVKTGKVVLGEAERGVVGGRETDGQIETPFLQLVMTRLWQEEMLDGSRVLRLDTLNRLGGAEKVVQDHLVKAMNKLPPDEQEVATLIFPFLVTRSRTKIAYPVFDLVEEKGIEHTRLSSLLKKLSGEVKVGGEQLRILREVSPPLGQPGGPRFEIFHDVLAPAILGYVQEAKKAAALRQRARRLIARALVVMLPVVLAMLGLVIWQYRQALSNEKIAEAFNNEIAPAFSELLYRNEDFDGNNTRFGQARKYCHDAGKAICEGVALANLGELYNRNGRYSEARPFFEDALKILGPKLPPEHPYIAHVLNGLAETYKAQDGNESDKAESIFKQALAILERDPGLGAADVGDSLRGLGEIYQSRGDFDKAEQFFKHARDLHTKLLGPQHQEVAVDLRYLADLYLKRGDQHRGDFTNARMLYEQARPILEKALGPDYPNIAALLRNLAVAFVDEGDYAKAEPLFKQAIEIHRKAPKPEVGEIIGDLINLGILYAEQKRYAEAEQCYAQARTELESLTEPDPSILIYVLNGLAFNASKQGRYRQAESLLNQALDTQKKEEPPKRVDEAYILSTQAECYRDQQKYDKAVQSYLDALKIQEKESGKDHWSLSYTLNGLALAYSSQHQYTEAEPLFKRALALREDKFGPWHSRVAEILENYAPLLQATNREAEADRMEERAKAIRNAHAKESPRPTPGK